jgi:hypothetical protein
MTARFPRSVLAPTAVLFGIMTAHAVLETARDALFIAKLGPDRLAWAYLAIAGGVLLAVTASRRWGKLRDPRRMTIGFLIAASAGTWVLAATITQTSSLVFVLYVWTGLVATLVVPSFWTTIDRSLRITEAKRSFAVIGAGGISGAMFGSAIAGAAGRVVSAHHLVTIGAVAFGLASIVAVAFVPHPVDEVLPKRADDHPPPRRHYVRWMVAIAVVSTITLTLGDLTFKRALAARLDPGDLATAFGAIYTALNMIGLAIQLVLTPRLLGRLGVGGALVVLPSIMVATATGFAITGAALAIVALKLGDGGLRHSLHRVVSEILYVPLASSIRDRAKPIADAVGQRGGQAAAALLVFALGALGAGEGELAIATGCFGAAWLGVAVLVRQKYVQQFRDTLHAGEIHRGVPLPELDATSREVLVESLSSPDEAEALGALELLARGARVPALVLFHPSHLVVRRALALLANDPRPEIARVLGHLLGHADAQIRAAAVAASGRANCHLDRVVAALEDPEPEVRAAALVACSDRREYTRGVASGLAALLGGATSDRVALARAIAFVPHERFRPLLEDLLARREPPVVREVLRVFAVAPELANPERLLDLLQAPYVRGAVRDVFTAIGTRAFECVTAALDDPRTPLGVRRHIPRTLSRFGSPAAAAALVSRLLREPDGTTEFKILRALGRMRGDNPRLPIDTAAIRKYVQRAVADAARYTSLLDYLGPELAASPSPSGELVRDLLVEKRRYAIEHVFRALDILQPAAGFRSVHDAITSDDAERRAAAREIVEHLVRSETRIALLAILDDLDPEERRAKLGPLAAGPYASTQLAFAVLLRDPSESLRCVVAHHVADRKLHALRPELTRLQELGDPPFVVEAFQQAIARLDG